MCAQAACALSPSRSCEQTICGVLWEEQWREERFVAGADDRRIGESSASPIDQPIPSQRARVQASRWMSATNGNREAEPSVLTAQVAAAERVARAVIFAFEACEEGGVPLSQVQKVAVVEASLLEFDGLEADLSSLAGVGALIRELCRDEPPR
jgi:hypothetical protein